MNKRKMVEKQNMVQMIKQIHHGWIVRLQHLDIGKNMDWKGIRQDMKIEEMMLDLENFDFCKLGA